VLAVAHRVFPGVRHQQQGHIGDHSDGLPAWEPGLGGVVSSAAGGWRVENILPAASAIPINGHRPNLDESAIGKLCLVLEPHVVVRVCVEVQHSVEWHFNFPLQQPAVFRDRVVVHKTIEILRLKAVASRFRLERKHMLAGDVVVHSHS